MALSPAMRRGYPKRMNSILSFRGAGLAYRFQAGAAPVVVFLPGYMSDMTGTKAEALAGWAQARGQAFLRLDYSGCGASGGDFLDGSIARWTEDVLALIDHVAPQGRVVLVGSSMGGWVALRAGLALGGRLGGLVGIAAAPDFTDWGLALTNEDHAALQTRGWFTRASGYGGDYRYSRALMDGAAAARVMGGPIGIAAPVRLLHGQNDDAVPWRLSLDVAERLRSVDVQVILIKDGDHRLSRPADLAVLVRTVATLAGEVE